MDEGDVTRQAVSMWRALLTCILLCCSAHAEEQDWPPACTASEIASASPAPMASDASSLRSLPVVFAWWPPSVAFVVALDEAHRPMITCYLSGASDPRLLAHATLAVSDLVLSAPNAPNTVTAEGRYLVRVATNFGLSWMSVPPPYPLLRDCDTEMGRRSVPSHTEVALAPRPVSRVTPEYPEWAEAEGIEGEVEVYLDVFSNGAASPVCIANGSPPGWFEQAAVDAIRQWRFEPRAGMALYRVTVKFRMH